MSKRLCLNLLLSSNSDSPESLSSLTSITTIAKELRLKPHKEIEGIP